jgi:hypothetical protein
MFLFLTTPGHGYTVEAFVQPLAGADVPRCEVSTYGAVLRSTHTMKAVHVFTDLERLSDAELFIAANLYRTFCDLGIPCLNDPAKVMGRYQLLCNLFEEGINPFAAYRADERPKPTQFPVFVRNESDHSGPMSPLLKDQDELEHCLNGLVVGGRPLRGLLVIEYAAEPLTNGVWRKTGTYRIGKSYSVNSQALADNWVVKQYAQHVTNDALQLEEQAAIIANDVPETVCRAFDIAGVEWGRADHASFRGREIIYEINTAPYPQLIDRVSSPIRIKTKHIAFDRKYALLREMDWGDGRAIRYRGKPFWRRLRESQRVRRLFTRSAA